MMIWRMLQSTDPVAHKAEFEAYRQALADQTVKSEEGLPLEARRGSSSEEDKPYAMVGSIAVISLIGAMTKKSTSFSSGASTIELRSLLRAAARDEDVTGILLRVDSPGGSVSGTADLADDIASITQRKKCVAYVEDTCCSAALWVASQCSAIYSNRTAIIGSIGTYMAIEDYSRLAANQGIEVHVLSTGKHKGAGVPGAAITSEQLAHFQQTVDDLNEHFLSAVSKGRGMSRSRLTEYADGRVWVGEQAVEIGLIDGIASFDDVLLTMQKSAKRSSGASANYDLTEGSLRIDGPLGLALDSVLTAVRGSSEGVSSLAARIAKVKAMRESQGRAYSTEGLEKIKEIEAALLEVAGEFSALRESCESLSPDSSSIEDSTSTGNDEPESASLEEAVTEVVDEDALLAHTIENSELFLSIP